MTRTDAAGGRPGLPLFAARLGRFWLAAEPTALPPAIIHGPIGLPLRGAAPAAFTSRSRLDERKQIMPTPEQTRALQRYSEVWATGDLDTLDELFTPDCVRHGPDLEGISNGIKGQKEIVEMYRTAMSDLKCPIAATAGEGDIVLTRWTASGTNDGPIMGLSPTGKACQVIGFWMHRFEGSKMAEEWATWDTQGFLSQLGLSIPVNQA